MMTQSGHEPQNDTSFLLRGHLTTAKLGNADQLNRIVSFKGKVDSITVLIISIRIRSAVFAEFPWRRNCICSLGRSAKANKIPGALWILVPPGSFDIGRLSDQIFKAKAVALPSKLYLYMLSFGLCFWSQLFGSIPTRALIGQNMDFCVVKVTVRGRPFGLGQTAV